MRGAGAAVLSAAIGMGAAVGCAPGGVASPAPYYLLRHSNLSSTPLGLATGTVELRGQCLYLGPDLLIWPEHYSLSPVDGSAVVVGDRWTIAPGDAIEVGGGQYEDPGDLPSSTIGGLPPCSGPYLWVAEVLRVGPGGSVG